MQLLQLTDHICCRLVSAPRETQTALSVIRTVWLSAEQTQSHITDEAHVAGTIHYAAKPIVCCRILLFQQHTTYTPGIRACLHLRDSHTTSKFTPGTHTYPHPTVTNALPNRPPCPIRPFIATFFDTRLTPARPVPTNPLNLHRLHPYIKLSARVHEELNMCLVG